MDLELHASRIRAFEDQMGNHGPWMHAYALGENIYTGYFKYEGLPSSLTFVNRHSSPDDMARMKRAYESRQHELWTNFVASIFDHVEPDREKRGELHLLDIASATGALSLRAVQEGFGRVTSSEIRPGQAAQQALLLDSLADSTYRERIVVLNDPLSADAPEYPARYLEDAPDVACSFGLLYHLQNPLQHLMNLYRITRRSAVIYTMTHYHPLAKQMWMLALEDADWITKATSSISWTPHFLEVERLSRAVGFRRVTRLYPRLFHDNFPEMTDGYTRWTDVKLAVQMGILRLTGLRFGHMRDLEFSRFQYTHLNPTYVAYVCEK